MVTHDQTAQADGNYTMQFPCGAPLPPVAAWFLFLFYCTKRYPLRQHGISTTFHEKTKITLVYLPVLPGGKCSLPVSRVIAIEHTS